MKGIDANGVAVASCPDLPREMLMVGQDITFHKKDNKKRLAHLKEPE